MDLDCDTVEREASEEATAMEHQMRFMVDEVEDAGVVYEGERAEDNLYLLSLGTYEQSLQLLNISDRTAFPFLRVNPISLGRSKESTYAEHFPKSDYHERKLLYVTKQFEYFVDGQRFNKESRRWSYFPAYLHGLLWSLYRIGIALGRS